MIQLIVNAFVEKIRQEQSFKSYMLVAITKK